VQLARAHNHAIPAVGEVIEHGADTYHSGLLGFGPLRFEATEALKRIGAKDRQSWAAPATSRLGLASCFAPGCGRIPDVAVGHHPDIRNR